MFKGMPTKIDVKKLYDHFIDINECDTFTGQECADIIGEPKDSYRFRTVFMRWRTLLFDMHNMLVVSLGNDKYKVADPEERVNYASAKVSSGRRSIGKAIVVAYKTDMYRLDNKLKTTANAIVGLNDSKLRLASIVMPK
jgi:hypothetical protein